MIIKHENSEIQAPNPDIEEVHPLGFFLPENAKLLILGSFPPQRKRWSMDFYYPNFQNDFWRIMGLVFYNDKEYFIKENKKTFDRDRAASFCYYKGIGMGDTAMNIIRLNNNASDKFLHITKTFSPEKILRKIPECKAIAVTGAKAMEALLYLLDFSEPAVGNFSPCNINNREIMIYRMPSTSRAYPKPLNEKAEFYRKMFESLEI
ncbi:MAG: uracil-DNA glycosylase family protein [Bacteroidales bacterium]|jgi:G:T/U-mismatch repair DNA glycosylase|nr:uracil-DNA glycosylase family protein [Bacteroidales bacterium]